MRRVGFLVLLTFCVATGLNACAPATTPEEEPAAVERVANDADPGLEGAWRGVLDAGPRTLRLELEVELGDPPAATLISLDQGGARVPLEHVVIDGAAISVGTPGRGLRYDGVLDGERIEGEFNQGRLSTQLTFERGRFEAVAAPADPADRPFEVQNGEVRLTGALRLPEGEGPFPGVVILSGSGPQDRDGTVAGQPVYMVLADALAGAGVASLRLDDRGVGGSSQIVPEAPADLAGDAAAALGALTATSAIACAGYLGHSEGGLIALLAAPAADPTFIVSLAGMHLDMETTLLTQAEAMILASGGNAAGVAANQALQRAVFAAMRAAAPGETPAAIEAALLDGGAPDAVARREAAVWGQPYAVAALQIDPDAAAAAYAGPLLAIFAERDLQVLAEPSAAALAAARGDSPTDIVVLPGVNHLFQTAQTGLPQEYGAAEHAMAPDAAADIAARTAALAAQACGG